MLTKMAEDNLWAYMNGRARNWQAAWCGAADLARELEFLADNLDSERDYAFMRP